MTTIGLTVIVPSFSLATSATSLTIPEASSGNSTISVSGVNGFAGSVNLTVTGLPSGVTASFSPLTATTTAPSKVTFNVGASASAGTYPVTITGTSGTLNSTIPISLTVVAPSFSLAASPTSLIIPRAGSGSSTISVSGINGFNGGEFCCYRFAERCDCVVQSVDGDDHGSRVRLHLLWALRFPRGPIR